MVATAKELDESNTLIYFRQAVTQPARLAGTILIAQSGTKDEEVHASDTPSTIQTSELAR